MCPANHAALKRDNDRTDWNFIFEGGGVGFVQRQTHVLNMERMPRITQRQVDGKPITHVLSKIDTSRARSNLVDSYDSFPFVSFVDLANATWKRRKSRSTVRTWMRSNCKRFA